MNTVVQKKRATALRSKKYKQGTRQLNTGNLFCCLGVLCDVYLKEHGKEWGVGSGIRGEGAELPSEVRSWAGLRYRNPILAFAGVPVRITGLNDCTQLSFNILADLIEAQL